MSGVGPDLLLDAELSAILDAWPAWGVGLTGGPQILGPVQGGRTNRSFRLAGPGLNEHLLLRLNHPDPARLGIDRAMEREILCQTATAGISRPCLYWASDNSFAVFPWLDARPWTTADLACPDQRARLWPLIERLGDLRIHRPRRSYFTYLSNYWNQLEHAGAVDSALEKRWQQFARRLHSFDRASWRERLVHHDLIPANILDTGLRLYLIDWEYAAPGHPGIDAWYIARDCVEEPFIGELVDWTNDLWERIVRAERQYSRST